MKQSFWQISISEFHFKFHLHHFYYMAGASSAGNVYNSFVITVLGAPNVRSNDWLIRV